MLKIVKKSCRVPLRNVWRLKGGNRLTLAQLFPSVTFPTSNDFDYADVEDASDDKSEDANDDISIGDETLNLHQNSSHLNKDEVVKQIINALVLCGLQDHFDCTNRDSKKHLRVLANYIHWSHRTLHGRDIVPQEDVVLEFFKQLLNKHYALLQQYCGHLRDYGSRCAPETIMNYVRDLVHCFEWLALYAPEGTCQGMEKLTGITHVVKLLNVSQSKAQKTARSKSHTVEEKVRCGLMPEGGLQQLHEAILAELPWARTLPKSNIDAISVRRFMELMYTSMWTSSANGRPQAIEHLDYKQGLELVTGCYTMSDDFKTRSTYGYQPVTSGPTSAEFLHIYHYDVRPQIVRSRTPQDAERYFLDYYGQPESRLGKRVTICLKRLLGKSINVTTIRSMVEMEMQDAMLRGDATAIEHAGVRNINGHSSATVSTYYLLQDRQKDVYNSRNAFAMLTNSKSPLGQDKSDDTTGIGHEEDNDWTAHSCVSPTDNIAVPSTPILTPTLTLTPTLNSTSTIGLFPSRPTMDFQQNFAARMALIRNPPQPASWGADHPHKKTGKAPWTEAEKAYVGLWVEEHAEKHGEEAQNVAQCLKFIRNDPHALRIFHANHVVDCTRLRHGWRQYLKDKVQEAALL